MGCENVAEDYVTRVLDQPSEIDAGAWNALLARQPGGAGGPFMRHDYLAALDESGCAAPATGWGVQWVTLWRGSELQAAAPLYLKSHSRGEYVFDWAWAEAYERNGLPYYPKGLVAVPFTPVPGPRLLALDATARAALLQALIAHCEQLGLSSLHLLFGAPQDIAACREAGLLLRQTVQFHWQNQPGPGYADFEDFLATLKQDKRKKIRQERRKVMDAGVRFDWRRGKDITSEDWDFFYRCYERTYLEHGNRPYLSRDFFEHLRHEQPGQWLLFIARNAAGARIAASLVALSDDSDSPEAAYGRYWGALERVDCLHFEACYYQPLAWCIAQGVQRFEGGAQGEHKMARALLPVTTWSAHWLAHPAFSDAVERYLEQEGEHMGAYLEQLEGRSPLKVGG
ncbi:GNAT family N-acetyltransferase [Malikia sp.]|uniref:GNAT family N-acetyltransferase n=1 Tax=Malikia sp. TaxID=2070706 RepID=UPI002618EDAC|nr:GNAT family N-acetyltransferase [Malikia sp.]MDD2727841.1 GNAT family N-acetyltransferase [Malikia sp.]